MQHLLRKQMILLILPLLLANLNTSGQLRSELNLENHDEKPFHFGIYLGSNRSHYSFSHHPRFTQYDSVLTVEGINSTGINLGWLVNFRLGDHFDLRTYPLNLVFTEKSFLYNLKYPQTQLGEKADMIKKIQGITLSLPLQIKFSSDRINNLKVYMFGGGKAEYDFAASSGEKKAEELIKLDKIDYGIEGGIGFHFYFPVFVLSPELKIGYGLRNVHVRDQDLKYSNVIDRINSRTITFSLTVE
jgi:hypothetical protein